MSQTKQECMEYILVLLDDLKSEINKIMHKDNYQKYDGWIPDLDYCHEGISKIDEELETLENMFNDCIPAERKTIDRLQRENMILKQRNEEMASQIKELQKPPCITFEEIEKIKEKLYAKGTE